MRTPEIKPEVSFVYELLKEIKDGRIRIPGFQRPYVWRRDQMRDFLDSIYKQYPIGSILLWEPNEAYNTLNWVGPVEIPPSNGPAALVLDGQQRLSTLVGTLISGFGQPNPRDDDPGRWKILFNAKDLCFEHMRDGSKIEAYHFPLHRLMETIDFLQECSRMQKEGGANSDHWINRIQQLARIFQSYKAPVIRVRNTDMSEAVNIFARLNSKGQRMSADQMVSALVYNESKSGGFCLSQKIDSLCSHVNSLEFGDVDRTIVLRILLACMNHDVYNTDWTSLTREKRPDIANWFTSNESRVQDGLTNTINFLQSCGVYHERLLPYSMQLVVLSSFYFNQNNPTAQQKDFLRRWFWVSSFTGWGGGGNPSRTGGLVKEFASKVAKTQSPRSLENMRLDEKALPFPKSFDTRSARVRALLLVLLEEKPCHPNSNPINSPWNLISQHGPNAIGHVVRRRELGELYSSPGNRILKPDTKKRGQAKTWLLPNVSNDVLKSHAIPNEAYDALLNNEPIKFVELRQNYMMKLELDFMRCFGVTAPGDDLPQLAPVDIDDSASLSAHEYIEESYEENE